MKIHTTNAICCVDRRLYMCEIVRTHCSLFLDPSSQCHLGFEALHAAIIRKICEKWKQQQKTVVGYIAHERNINAKINRKFIVIILIWSRCSRQPVSQLQRWGRKMKRKAVAKSSMNEWMTASYLPNYVCCVNSYLFMILCGGDK